MLLSSQWGVKTDEYVSRCPTLYRSIHGAVGTLHTCLLLSNFQQICVRVHVHVHIHNLYMYNIHLHVHVHVCIHDMYMYVHMCTVHVLYVYIYMYLYIYVYMHVHVPDTLLPSPPHVPSSCAPHPQQLQEREAEVEGLQEELSRGAAALEELSSQLEGERRRGDPALVAMATQRVCGRVQSVMCM